MNKKIIYATLLVLLISMLIMLCAKRSDMAETAETSEPVMNDTFASITEPDDLPEVEVGTAENPSIEAVLMRFEGVWPINNESELSIVRVENSDFTPDNFTQGEEWVIWFSHGSVLTDKQAISHTASSITFHNNDGFYRVEENIAGKLDVFFGPATDSMDLIFTTSETVEVKIPGTWQTASMVLGADGDISPEHYVQFTDSSINYGHMKDGEFVLDYSDRIALLDETTAGGFIVQAESSNGIKYTYKTCESENEILEYYESWNEAEFPQMYRGGASLRKCN